MDPRFKEAREFANQSGGVAIAERAPGRRTVRLYIAKCEELTARSSGRNGRSSPQRRAKPRRRSSVEPSNDETFSPTTCIAPLPIGARPFGTNENPRVVLGDRIGVTGRGFEPTTFRL